jgi:hypothetical protein
LVVDGNINGNLNNEGETDVTTGNVTGDVTNEGGNVHIGGNVDGNVETTNGGKTVIDGNVDGTVTDKTGGTTIVGGNTNGQVDPDVVKDPTLTVAGVPSKEIVVGSQFTLTPSITGGTWTFDESFLEEVSVNTARASVDTATPSTITFKAVKVGKTVATYEINGQKVESTITIVASDKKVPVNNNPKAPVDNTNSTAKAKTVKTGDTASVVPFGLMLTLSLMVLISMALVSKKRRKNNR